MRGNYMLCWIAFLTHNEQSDKGKRTCNKSCVTYDKKYIIESHLRFTCVYMITAYVRLIQVSVYMNETTITAISMYHSNCKRKSKYTSDIHIYGIVYTIIVIRISYIV